MENPIWALSSAQVTYYEFKKEEVDAAVEGQRTGRRLTHVPSRVENKESFNMLMVRPPLPSSHSYETQPAG